MLATAKTVRLSHPYPTRNLRRRRATPGFAVGTTDPSSAYKAYFQVLDFLRKAVSCRRAVVLMLCHSALDAVKGCCV